MPETILLCIAAVFCAIGILYSIRCIFMQIYRKHRPKSRIVIGVQNGEERIEVLVRKLIKHYPNSEILIIDGGSADDTCDIIDKLCRDFECIYANTREST